MKASSSSSSSSLLSITAPFETNSLPSSHNLIHTQQPPAAARTMFTIDELLKETTSRNSVDGSRICNAATNGGQRDVVNNILNGSATSHMFRFFQVSFSHLLYDL